MHVHDIFWPAEYPDDWIFNRGQTWNEQYVRQAFLMYNNTFETVIYNSILCRRRTEAWNSCFAERLRPNRPVRAFGWKNKISLMQLIEKVNR